MSTDLHSPDLLRLAAKPSRAAIDKMAHALGWPSIGAMIGRGGRIGRPRWSNPYRNFYLGSLVDPDWVAAADDGLASMAPTASMAIPVAGEAYWWVTPLGMAAVRLRLNAARLALKVRT